MKMAAIIIIIVTMWANILIQVVRTNATSIVKNQIVLEEKLNAISRNQERLMEAIQE